jgi:hypothetical protein
MESTMEQVYKNWTEFLAHWVTIMFKVGKEMAGEAFVQKVEEELYQGSLRLGTALRSQMGVEGTDCTAIGRVFDAVDESMANYWDGHVENTPGGFEKHITTCPVAKTFSRDPEICARFMTAGARGVVASINPDATFCMEELIPKGDKSCHYRIEIT